MSHAKINIKTFVLQFSCQNKRSVSLLTIVIGGHISYRSNTYVLRPGDRPTRKRPQGWITRLKGHPKAKEGCPGREKGLVVHLYAR